MPSAKYLKTPSTSSQDTTKTSSDIATPNPSSPSDPNINSLLSDLQSSGPNDDDKPAAKRLKSITLTPEQFERLLQTCSKQQEVISHFTSGSPISVDDSRPQRQPAQPAYYSNAKYEEISCKAIKPQYDGSEEHLIPFLTRLDLRRQNEGWAPATFVTINAQQYDLTCHFAGIKESDLTTLAEARWTSPTVDQDKHTVGHPTYHARLLAMVLMNSITDDLMTTLIHRVPTNLRNDGTYLLWSICHNIHRNNVAFTEHIREKISIATLSTFNNDVNKYIIFIKDNLKMISTTTTPEHNGLITYILRQLKLSPIPLFQDFIRKLHIEFQEGKHPLLTPTLLLKDVEDKIRVLKHADEWREANNPQPNAMALAADVRTPTTFETILLKQIQALTKMVEQNKNHHSNKGSPYSEWKHNPPTNPLETKTYNGKIFRWCLKCNNGQGQWASAHDTTTHIDGYKHERSKPHVGRSQQTSILRNTNHTQRDKNQPKTPRSNVSFLDILDPSNTNDSNANTAQMSLSDGIENCWRFDVSDSTDD
jgi:hypothetical protein